MIFSDRNTLNIIMNRYCLSRVAVSMHIMSGTIKFACFLLLRPNVWPRFLQKVNNSIICDSPFSNPPSWWRFKQKIYICYRNNSFSKHVRVLCLLGSIKRFKYAKYGLCVWDTCSLIFLKMSLNFKKIKGFFFACMFVCF